MNAIARFGIACMLAILGAGCGRTVDPHAAWRETATQVSTFPAASSARFVIEIPVTDLQGRGDHGIGFTTEGEGFVLHRGEFFAIARDGAASPLPTNAALSFALLTWFEPDATYSVVGMDQRVFSKTMEWKQPDSGRIQAIRIEGRFRRVELLSPNAVKRSGGEARSTDQPIAILENINGVLIGFRSSESLGGILPPSFTLFFLSEDHASGGWVKEFDLLAGRIEIDVTPALYIYLPEAR